MIIRGNLSELLVPESLTRGPMRAHARHAERTGLVCRLPHQVFGEGEMKRSPLQRQQSWNEPDPTRVSSTQLLNIILTSG